MKSSMIRPVRTEADLGNPPTEFSTSDVEEASFMVKYGLHFDPQKPHVFIESVKDVIETQYRNKDRAIFGKGPYRLIKGFEHFLVNDLKWSSVAGVKKLDKVKEFQKATMRPQKDYVTITTSATPQCSALSVTAMKNLITKVPIVILTTMFEKANEFLWYEDMIVRKPGADDGSYIVAGHTNQIYCATPGKGGSFKCDPNCVNASIRNYILAVAEKYVKLPEFITWYKRSKSGASITKMALGGVPKTAGKKPSTRKRSIPKRPSSTSLVDLLADCNDQLEQSSNQKISHQF